MKLFFYRYTLEILHIKEVQHLSMFDKVIEKLVSWRKFRGHVLWLHPHPKEISTLLETVSRNKLYELKSLVLAVKDPEATHTLIKKHFYIVKAAGGVVEKDNKVLLIYRRGCWDLPKGKQKATEQTSEAATREVEEECGVKVRCRNKIGTTYHAISLKNGQQSLKETSWYSMELLDDSQMQPQQEEDIEEVAWFELKVAYKKLKHSYASIRYLMRLRQLQRAQAHQPIISKESGRA